MPGQHEPKRTFGQLCKSQDRWALPPTVSIQLCILLVGELLDVFVELVEPIRNENFVATMVIIALILSAKLLLALLEEPLLLTILIDVD